MVASSLSLFIGSRIWSVGVLVVLKKGQKGYPQGSVAWALAGKRGAGMHGRRADSTSGSGESLAPHGH
jgi:hypothetical protein